MFYLKAMQGYKLGQELLTWYVKLRYHNYVNRGYTEDLFCQNVYVVHKRLRLLTSGRNHPEKTLLSPPLTTFVEAIYQSAAAPSIQTGWLRLAQVQSVCMLFTI